MFTSQAVADLAFMLSGMTSVDAADTAIARALRAAGLAESPTLNQERYLRLVTELAAQGGVIEQLAMQFAIEGLGMPSGDASVNSSH
ncbi:MAG: hypothetical protein FJ037_10835 [Chloroflexi bacterium]|nr:hypothetical protein [Chloroflexota bacterium]